MSIFEPIYTQSLKVDSFWSETNISDSRVQSKPIKYSGSLCFHYKNEEVLTEVFLTSRSLYFVTESKTVISKINWCIVESFSESNGTETRFGFTVKTSSSSHDFFTSTDASLQIWMSHLASVAVMNDFEENFVIIKPIDSGRFGTVYLCHRVNTNFQFALKKISKSDLASPKSLNFLYNEIAILRKIDHPFVIKLFSVYEDDDSVSLLLEYIPYGNLYQRIKQKKKLLEKDVMMFSRNLFEVLFMLHSKGIVHRDLKLENILMSSKLNDFEFKICDFGLACYIGKLTRTRSGSPGYMAPEILLGHKYTSKIDVFSSGVIIFVLITGELPFKGNTLAQVIEKNSKCEIDFEAERLKSASVVAKTFLKEVLSAEPETRPSAQETLASLWLRFRKFSDSDMASATIRTDVTRETINHWKSLERVSEN